MLLEDLAPAARRALVPQFDIAAGNGIDVGHFSLLRFSPDGSADRLSKVGAPESITSEVKDSDFGDRGLMILSLIGAQGRLTSPRLLGRVDCLGPATRLSCQRSPSL